MNSFQRTLRFGVIGRDATISPWQGRCLDLLTAEPGVEAVVWVQTEGVGDGDAAGGGVLAPAWRRLTRSAGGGALATIQSCLKGCPVIPASLAAFPDLTSFDLDFVLSFLPSAVTPGPAAGMARHGLWCFEFDHLDGWPPGLGEIVRGLPTLSARLVAYEAGATDRRICYQGCFPTVRRSYPATMNQLCAAMVEWPRVAVRRLRLGGEVGASASPPPPPPPPPPLSPGAAQVLAYFWCLLVRRGQGVYFRFCREIWNVGEVRSAVADIAAGKPMRVDWHPPPPPDAFIADPFIIDGEPATVVEAYDFRTGLGALRVVGEDVSPRGLAAPTHRSYPYLFRHDGQIYCVPESCADGEVALYRAVAYPQHWERVATLLADVPAVDTTVFQHEGRWWLLCADHRRMDTVKLFAWHADALFGPWTAHPLNPIKSDVRSSRPAGTPFVVAGQLFRPAQDCAETYGAAIALNRVDVLSPTDFRETVVTMLKPDPDGPYPDGLHTLCVAADRVVIDGKRRVFSWRAVFQALRSVFG